MCKKACKECPWTKDSPHEIKSWQDFIKYNVEDGGLSSPIHRCHMITKKTFNDDLLEEPTDDVCQGSLAYNNYMN